MEAVLPATILVVDEVSDHARLERAGYEVLAASSAEEALRIALNADIDLMVVSQRLQGPTDGLDLVRRVKAAGRNLPTILLTPPGAEEPLGAAHHGDVTDCIAKTPRFIDCLLPAIERALREKKTRCELAAARAKLAVFEDDRELKRLQEALRTSEQRKNDFLATLAHELRNPLAPIRNALYVMRLTVNNPKSVEDGREMIERQVKHMVRLIDDLLDLSRITRGRIQLRKEKVELAAVVNSAVEGIRPLIDVAGHELFVELPPEPNVLEADAKRLTQILGNLLNNAAKYTEPGGKIWLRARRDECEIVLTIRDTGAGIPADALPSIFEMFAQTGRGLDRAEGGMGIGLSLVRGLVTLHGGTVTARSEGPGKGSEFEVRLPLEKARATTPSSPSHSARGRGARTRRSSP